MTAAVAQVGAAAPVFVQLPYSVPVPGVSTCRIAPRPCVSSFSINATFCPSRERAGEVCTPPIPAAYENVKVGYVLPPQKGESDPAYRLLNPTMFACLPFFPAVTEPQLKLLKPFVGLRISPVPAVSA